MSLVAYASSDEDSEVEKDEEVETPISLPKKKDPVKITIPSLKEFEEEKKPEAKKKIQPKGGSGLFSILPPPKNSLGLSKPGFTPYVFSKKKDTKSTPVQKQKQISTLKKTTSDISSSDTEISIEDPENSVSEQLEDSSEKVDFFSLSTKTAVDDQTLKQYEIKFDDTKMPVSNYDNFLNNEEPIPKTLTGDNYPASNVSSTSWEENDIFVPAASSSTINWGSLEMRNTLHLSEPSGQPDFLKDEEFIKLKGRKDKGDINIIDVDINDKLTDKDQWLMQSLTQETHRPLKRKHDMPTSQAKRKHQITYLAFQAKERELALKDQWALSGRTRRETQAKYGF